MEEAIKSKNLKCSKALLLWELMETTKSLWKRSGLKQGLSISVDKKSTITEESISVTYKQMFCPICVSYDCSVHQLPASASTHNYQYARNEDPTHSIALKSSSLQQLLHRYRQLLLQNP